MGKTRFQKLVRAYGESFGTQPDAAVDEDPNMVAKIYNNNKPRIFLETLTARSTTLVFMTTYLAFIVGFAIDVSSVYQGFSSSGHEMSGLTTTTNINGWTGTVTGLNNVISFSLVLQQSNFTSIHTSQLEEEANKHGDEIVISYNTELWACYRTDGCHQSFGNTKSPNSWQRVFSSQDGTERFPVNAFYALGKGVVWEVIPTLYQNQESLPNNGKVRSYFIQLNYTSNPLGLFTTVDPVHASLITYSAYILQQPSSQLTTGSGSIILLFVAIVTLVSFVTVMLKQRKKWLSEQRWVCFYLTALIFFINPVFCVIIWLDDPSPAAVFAFYVCDAIGQSLFVVVWLMFADGINRKRLSAWLFYGPKILIGVLIFVMYVTQMALLFPSVNPASSVNSQRSPVLAVSNWSFELQRSFSAVSGTLLSLIVFWVIYWIITLILTSRKLRNLPYMNTRYLQLSFRFFFMQASLLAAYFVFGYGVVIVFLVRGEQSGNFSTMNDLTNYVNTLFREQTQLFGKIVFLTAYALVLTFLFLPAGLVDNPLTTTLASTYVISEREKKQIERVRSEAIARVRLLSVGMVNQLIKSKKEVFCVDTALKFCNISYEAYYDPIGMKTAAGYDTKPMELAKYGYELIETIYRPDHETFCIIARHTKLQRIVVCFRGTSCKKHWADNLNYAKRELLLPDLAALDAIDGLDCLDNVSTPIDTCDPAISLRGERLPADCESGDSVAPPSSTVTPPGREEGPYTTNSFIAAHKYHSLSSIHSQGSLQSPANGKSPNDGWMRARRRSTQAQAMRALDNDDDDESDVDCDDLYDIAGGGGVDESGKSVESRRESRRAAEGEHGSRARSHTVESTLERGMTNLADRTSNLVAEVGNRATDLVVGVAAVTPGLNKIVNPHVHSGFWEAYSVVREDLHSILRRELQRNPSHLFFCGHSLGGALATIAALDSSITTVPRVNAYLEKKMQVEGAALRQGAEIKTGRVTAARHLLNRPRVDIFKSLSPRVDIPVPTSDPIPFPLSSANLMEKNGDDRPRHISFDDSSVFTSPPDLPDKRFMPSPIPPSSMEKREAKSWPKQHLMMSPALSPVAEEENANPTLPTPKPLSIIKISMYSFGSPRVGNSSFAQLFNRMVPDSFRTVIDGDVVTSVPPTGYRHIGTEAVVDNLGAGSIILDPSFIERRLRTNTKSSVSVHSLLVYRKGLQGVKDAAEYMKQRALDPTFSVKKGNLDAVRLALSATAIRRNAANARAPLQSPSIIGGDGHGSVVKTSERPLTDTPDALKLSDVIVESPVNNDADSVSKLGRDLESLLHDDNEHDLAEAHHYKQDMNEAEFLVSHALKNPGRVSGIQPIDTLINFLLPPIITPSSINTDNNNNTKTNVTLEFDTNDEDGDGLPYTTPK